MNSFITTLAGLFLVYIAVITTGSFCFSSKFVTNVFFVLVYCVDLKDHDLSKDEVIALTRDHFARRDPDELLNGFFPVWAVIQFLIACKFFISIT